MRIWDSKCTWDVTWLQDSKDFFILIGKGMVNYYWKHYWNYYWRYDDEFINYYWIVCEFGIVSVFRM